ncbi:hypothetical protein HK097_004895 [Rhizophlyctis rosea]|uniref:UspA domain-containing protein n=1 Tax=Rhizophlyctis rosea TaxID=64517 RepID=A0AAD5X5Q4_9FUNG|nr:hypothetical protein HK097_004895 [Rhizophlyctis rosea]
MQAETDQYGSNVSRKPSSPIVQTTTPALPPFHKRHILIPIDDSDHATQAIAWTISNILREDDHVTLLHVWPNVMAPNTFGVLIDEGEYIRKMQEKVKEASHDILKREGKALSQAEIKVTFTLISVQGDPREEIIAKINAQNIDLVVMGSRGRGAVKRALLGSVSDYIVHHAKCPVTIVKEQ